MADQQYRLTVSNEFRSITSANRIVGELSIPQDGDGLVVPLSADQLAAVKADQYLTVRKVSARVAAQAQADAEADKAAEGSQDGSGSAGDDQGTSTPADDAQAATEA